MLAMLFSDMKYLVCFCYFFILTAVIQPAKAQARYDSLITGIWKGSSLCQVKNSPCHDETVVYHISKKSGTDTFSVLANKIVNGAEEEMGVIPFGFNAKTMQLVSNAYNSTWNFTIKGNNMDGTLLHNGELYRIIKLSKTK